jgi:hypothetical protein
MIQSYLKDLAQSAVPELEWSIDFYTGQDNTGTVYSESGLPPDTYDPGLRYPEYMVFIRSSDWTFARKAVNKIFKQMHGVSSERVTADEIPYQVLFVEALSEPLRLGAQDRIMEYSINFQATIREVL